MSTKVQHMLNGVLFTPVNNDDFTINFERDPSVRFSNDVTATNTVEVPIEQVRQIRENIAEFGGQRAMEYNIRLADRNFLFMADISTSLAFRDVSASFNIERFKGKDDVIKTLEAITFEALYQEGKIRDFDMVQIPYVIMREDAGDKAFQAFFMMFIVGWQLAESIATVTRLVGELIAAVTPSVVVPVGTTVNTGQIVKYALLIALEAVKIVMLIVAFTRLANQFFEYIHPKLRYYKAMTVDKLLTIGLREAGLTYKSSLRQEFIKTTILPVPMDFKDIKWWQILQSEDDRIVNRGYPTASDTVSTVMLLIDEIEKMYNLRPVIRGNELHLEPKGNYNYEATKILPDNFNNQFSLENNFKIDTSEWWKNKVISYTNDITDKTLFDNPKGLRAEYLAYADNGTEWDRIRGVERIQINLALGTIKKDTKLDKIMREAFSTLDNFLGTNLLSKIKKRDGALAVSQSNFNITKLLYQVNGYQTSDYFNSIGAGHLYRSYHKIDEPSKTAYRVYGDVPMQINSETFLGILNDNRTVLETDKQIDVISCSYTYEDSTAITTFRLRDEQFGKFIKVKNIYEE